MTAIADTPDGIAARMRSLPREARRDADEDPASAVARWDDMCEASST